MMKFSIARDGSVLRVPDIIEGSSSYNGVSVGIKGISECKNTCDREHREWLLSEALQQILSGTLNSPYGIDIKAVDSAVWSAGFYSIDYVVFIVAYNIMKRADKIHGERLDWAQESLGKLCDIDSISKDDGYKIIISNIGTDQLLRFADIVKSLQNTCDNIIYIDNPRGTTVPEVAIVHANKTYEDLDYAFRSRAVTRISEISVLKIGKYYYIPVGGESYRSGVVYEIYKDMPEGYHVQLVCIAGSFYLECEFAGTKTGVSESGNPDMKTMCLKVSKRSICKKPSLFSLTSTARGFIGLGRWYALDVATDATRGLIYNVVGEHRESTGENGTSGIYNGCGAVSDILIAKADLSAFITDLNRSLIDYKKYTMSKQKDLICRLSRGEASSQGNLGIYRLSYATNVACYYAIVRTIQMFYDGHALMPDVEDALIEEYGIDRVAYVISAMLLDSGVFNKRNKDIYRQDIRELVDKTGIIRDKKHCNLNIPTTGFNNGMDILASRISALYLATLAEPKTKFKWERITLHSRGGNSVTIDGLLRISSRGTYLKIDDCNAGIFDEKHTIKLDYLGNSLWVKLNKINQTRVNDAYAFNMDNYKVADESLTETKECKGLKVNVVVKGTRDKLLVARTTSMATPYVVGHIGKENKQSYSKVSTQGQIYYMLIYCARNLLGDK